MMTNRLNDLWAEALLEQTWLVRQTADMVAKAIDPELLAHPQAISDYCLEPTPQRLNPLEFRGKRRAAASLRSAKTEFEARTASRTRTGKPLC